MRPKVPVETFTRYQRYLFAKKGCAAGVESWAQLAKCVVLPLRYSGNSKQRAAKILKTTELSALGTGWYYLTGTLGLLSFPPVGN